MSKSLIFIEKNNIEYSLDLVSVCKEISKETIVYAVGFNLDTTRSYYGVDFLINIIGDDVEIMDIKSITKNIVEIYKKYNFDNVVILASKYGRMLAPKIAMEIKTGLVADVTSIENEDGKTRIIRPAFDGKIFAVISCEKSPIMLTVRPGVFKNEIEESNYEITCIDYIKFQSNFLKITSIEKKPEDKDIRSRDILVSGGGGVKNNFEIVEKLANSINGGISASRSLVDKKIASRSIQVGQSGKTVSPKLYIALGIHGALQHVVGLNDVECIISVNKNSYAPILSISDIVVVGDAENFVNLLVEKINNEK